MYIITHLPTQTHYGRSNPRFPKTRIYTFETFEHAKLVGDSLATFHQKFNRFPKTQNVYQLDASTLTRDALESELWINTIDDSLLKNIESRNVAIFKVGQELTEDPLNFAFNMDAYVDSLRHDFKKKRLK